MGILSSPTANISPYTNRVADVKYPGQEGLFHIDAIVDTLGNVLFELPDEKVWTFESGAGNRFSEGLATVEIPLVDMDTVQYRTYGVRYDFKGIINHQGELVASDTAWKKITSFSQKRAFAQDTSDLWYMIDTKGLKINQTPYEEILYDNYQGQYFFYDGMAIIETLDGWTAVDSSGQILFDPLAFEIVDELSRYGNVLLFGERNEENEYQLKNGFWNPKTGLLIPAQYDYLAPLHDDTSILVAQKKDRTMYLDSEEGQVIWNQKNPIFKRKLPYNIDYMNRGYFYAGSPYVEKLAGFGGWGGSKNQFEDITTKLNPEGRKCQILVNDHKKVAFLDKFEGLNVYVINTREDTVFFSAQDSRLYMKVQAQDSHGVWRDIEYLPSSWCGNSYHTLFLPPGAQWSFVMPKYQGEIETFLRVSLRCQGEESDEQQIIFSKPFKGSVNPGQFWRKKNIHQQELWILTMNKFLKPHENAGSFCN